MRSIVLNGIFIIFIIGLNYSHSIGETHSKKETKVSSALSNALEPKSVEMRSATTGETVTLRVSSDVLRYDDNGLAQVYITLYELNQHILGELENGGVIIEIYDESQNLVQGRVKPEKIEAISRLEIVKFIDLPNYGHSNAGSVQSEGDGVLRSDEARDTFGVNGTGVGGAVISDGIDGLTESIGSGDLPSSGVRVPISPLTGGGISIDDPCPGFTSVTSTPAGRPDITTGAEGTAMLEIIHDIAPGAELYFAPGLASTLDHRRSRRCLTEVVDFIADDIGFFNAGPYDGNSAVSMESTNSVLSGVANFISVGNEALRHYQGTFTDTDDDTFHEFDVSLGLPRNDNSGETLNVTIRPGGTIRVFLQWNDIFGASSNDYDMILVTPADPAPLGAPTFLFVSINIQDGDDDPVEFIGVTNTGVDPLTLGIVIQNFAAPTPREFDMFVIGDLMFGPSGFAEIDEFQVAQSSVSNNSDADLVCSIGSVGLGASDLLGQSSSEIRDFSSQGPTNDGRMKPELVAPDGGHITGTGDFGSDDGSGGKIFFGTSAAAPHAAGVAALILDADPSLTPSQLSSVLQNTAIDLGSPGSDNIFGFGRIDAFAAVQSVADSDDGDMDGDGFDPADANQDGMVTSADITCSILALFGGSCAMPDCNEDGLTTSADITCIILKIFNQ